MLTELIWWWAPYGKCPHCCREGVHFLAEARPGTLLVISHNYYAQTLPTFLVTSSTTLCCASCWSTTISCHWWLTTTTTRKAQHPLKIEGKTFIPFLLKIPPPPRLENWVGLGKPLPPSLMSSLCHCKLILLPCWLLIRMFADVKNFPKACTPVTLV